MHGRIPEFGAYDILHELNRMSFLDDALSSIEVFVNDRLLVTDVIWKYEHSWCSVRTI